METLGRYRILGELGRGGGGVVYLGVDPALDRKVAIKTISLQGGDTKTSMGGSARERLMREARASATLGHPNIVTVYELGEHADLSYIAMEFVPGPTLAKLLASGEELAPVRVIELLRQIAAALDFAHGLGIIHRDVKPANIMISDAGPVKLADFGIAKLVDRTSTSLTKTGSIVGTINYMSPEQVTAVLLDGRSDQFSLAVIAFEMLAKKHPFDAESTASVLYRIVHAPPPSLHAVAPHLGPSADAVLQKALAKDRKDRYPTCRDFVDALAKALLSPDSPPTEGVVLPGREKQPARGHNRFWLLAIPIVAVLAGIGYWINSAGSKSVPRQDPASTDSGAPGSQTATETSQPDIPTTRVEINSGAKAAKKKEAPATGRRETKSQTKAAAKQDPSNGIEELPPAPATETGKYRGPPAGRFSWSGALLPGHNLTMIAARATAGTISGMGLPLGTTISVEVAPQEILVIDRPAQANGYKLILRNNGVREVNSISVRWNEVAP